ncbi:MAG: hypothetical protein HC914_00695 [Chloroflexaceae bacterium]|nr:hypothetical protein [Chloroflexaceae bacterium]
MASLDISIEQIVELIQQLSPTERWLALQALTTGTVIDRSVWREAIMLKGETTMRQLAAERGLNWDTMDDDTRLVFADDLIHEDRSC